MDSQFMKNYSYISQLSALSGLSKLTCWKGDFLAVDLWLSAGQLKHHFRFFLGKWTSKISNTAQMSKWLLYPSSYSLFFLILQTFYKLCPYIQLLQSLEFESDFLCILKRNLHRLFTTNLILKESLEVSEHGGTICLWSIWRTCSKFHKISQIW